MEGRRINLFARAPLLKTVLKSRVVQLPMMLITLFFFTLAILTGLFGTPAGNRTVGIAFVWIV